MKCGQCGFENREQSKFCGQCGTLLTETMVGDADVIDVEIKDEIDTNLEETDIEVNEVEPIVEVPDTEVNGMEVKEEIDEQIDETEAINSEHIGMEEADKSIDSTDVAKVEEKQNKSSIVQSKMLIGAGVGIFLIILLFLGGSKIATSIGTHSKFVDISNTPFVYAADGDYYIMPIGEEAIEVKGAIEYVRTKNAEDFYISTEEGKLYHYHLGNKDIEKIDKDVFNFNITEDGKIVSYETREDNDLYLYKNNEVELIEKDIRNSEMSRNGKYIAYISDYEVSEGGDLHLYRVGKDDEKLESDIKEVAIVLDDGSLYYLDEDNSLYYQKGKDKQRIAKDVHDYVFSTKGDKIAWINDDEELYVKVGKREEKIDKGVAYIYRIFWAQHSNRLDFVYNKDYEDNFIFMEEADDGEEFNNEDMTFDYASYIPMYAYSDDEDLYIKYHKGGEWKEDKIEHDEEIKYVRVSAYGDYVVYVDDDNQLFYWADGKSKLIEKDFDYNNGLLWMEKEKHTIIYTDEDNNLKISKKGKEGKEIIDDVKDFSVRNLKEILIADDDGDLMQVNLKGETEGIEDDFESFFYIGIW